MHGDIHLYPRLERGRLLGLTSQLVWPTCKLQANERTCLNKQGGHFS